MPPMPGTVVCPVYLHADRNPGRIALWESKSALTYRQLETEIAKRALWLRQVGVRPQDRVAIIAENSLDLAVLIHTLYRAGATAMPMNLRRAPDWWALCIREAGCARVFADRGRREAVEGMGIPVTPIDEMEGVGDGGSGSPAGRFQVPHDIPIDRETTIIFSSGSTGDPRGVILTFGNHHFNAIGSNENLPLERGDSWLAVLPFYHVGGMAILFRTALAGCSTCIVASFDPLTINGLIDEGKISHISLVPTMLESLIQARKSRPFPGSLKAILLGGAPAPEALLRSIESLRLPVLTTYGMTETASQITALSTGDPPEKIRSAGRPLRHAEVRIVDSRGRPVEAGKDGEIAVRGEIVFRDYIGESREKTFDPNGWFRTGDLGLLDRDGYLHVKGRLDDLIISGGENIYPGEIERVAEGFPGVIECAAMGVESEEWGQRPVLFVQVREEDFEGESMFREFLKARLSRIAIPDRIIVIEKLPRNSIGKIARERLKALYRERTGA